MLVNVHATTLNDFQGGGDTAELRIYATQDFFGGSVEYPASPGYFYKSVTCSVVGTTVTIPSFTLQSTTDSLVDTAKYVANLHDHLGNKVATLMNGLEFGVPPITPTTWENLRIYAAATRRRLSDSYYTANQIDARFDSLEDQIEEITNTPTIESYGAIGDMVYGKDGAISSSSNVFTSASANFTDDASFAGGKTIVINGAGPAGAPLVTTVSVVDSVNQLQLADNASTTVSGSSIYYYGTDNLAVIQGAVNDLVSQGGGRVNFEKTNYLVTDTIMWPGLEIQNEQVCVVEFVGAVGPMRSHWNNTNQIIGGDNDTELMTEGQTIIQLANVDDGKKVMDVDWITPLSTAPSGIQVMLQNMVFRTPVGANVTGVDLQDAYSVRIFDVNVEVADRPSNLPEPVSGSIGLRLPRVGNGAQVIAHRVGIAGFDTGYRHSEHADLDDMWVYRCKYPAAIEAGNHASKYGRVTFHACPNGIAATTDETAGLAYLTCQELNVEDSIVGGSHWSAPLNHILDLSNNLRGHIWHHKVVGFVGQEDGITKFGGANLITQQIGKRLHDGGVRGVGELPFDCVLTSPIGESIPPEENTGQEWMLRTGVTMEVFNADGVYFATGDGTCISRLETATGENYRVEVRVDIDNLQTQCNAGVCLKYVQGGTGPTGGTYIAAVIQMIPAGNQLRLFKMTNGVAVNLDTDTSIVFAANNDYKLWVDYDDGDIEVFVDEVSKCTATLSAGDIEIFGRSRQFGLYAFLGPSDDDRQTQFRDFKTEAL